MAHKVCAQNSYEIESECDDAYFSMILEACAAGLGLGALGNGRRCPFCPLHAHGAAI